MNKQYRSWLIWIFGTITVLLGGCISFVAFIDPYDLTGKHRYAPMNREPSYRDAKAEVVRNFISEKAGISTLVLGSSTLQKLDPESVADNGSLAFNASVTNATLLDNLAFYKYVRSLTNGKYPERVVIGIDAHRSVAKETVLNPALIWSDGLSDELGVIQKAAIIGRTWPDYLTLRRMGTALDVIRGKHKDATSTPSLFTPNGALIRDPYGHGGNRSKILVRNEMNRLNESIAKSVYALEPSEMQTNALRDILCDVTKNNGDAIVVIMPQNPTYRSQLQVDKFRRGIDASMQSVINIAEDCDAQILNVRNAKSLNLSPMNFHDHVHLNNEAEAKLAEQIKQL